jgi:hypothetical protein
MSKALFDVPSFMAVFLPLHSQHRLAELLKAGKAHAHMAIMHEALWRMRESAMTFEERLVELVAEMIATRRCAARRLHAWR